MGRSVLNIPTSLLKRYGKDKEMFYLFTAAVMLKLKFDNSICGYVDAKKLKKLLGIRKLEKAEHLFEQIKQSELFVYNEKNGILFVRSFKSDDYKVFKGHKRNYNAKSDFCKKLTIGRYTMRSLQRALREALFENEINAVQREHLNSWQNTLQELSCGCVTNAKQLATPLRKLSEGSGLSRSSVSRYLKRMANDGKVSKSEIVAECVINDLNEETEAEWRRNHPDSKFCVWHSTTTGHWSAWVTYGRMYSLNRTVTESLQHVIWNFDYTKAKSCNCYGDIAGRPD